MGANKGGDDDAVNELPTHQQGEEYAGSWEAQIRIPVGIATIKTIYEEYEIKCLHASDNPTKRRRLDHILPAQTICDEQLQNRPSN